MLISVLLVPIRRFLSITTANGDLVSRIALMLTRMSILILVGAATFIVRPVRVIAATPLVIGVII